MLVPFGLFRFASTRRTTVLLFLAATTANASPLFDDISVIDIELTGPVSSLIRDKTKTDEFEFIVSGDGFSVPVKLRTRGNSRLDRCPFPPLRLNFASDATAATVFEGQDRLKLVTHCNDKGHDANNVYEEFLAYRIMNLASDRSYRVRPLRIRYVDTDASKAHNILEKHGFLIESEDEFSRRSGASILQTEGVLASRMDKVQSTRVYVFQYLIGNTDWSLVKASTAKYCCHNGDLFEIDGKIIFVPYDFDLAGLVNASYARPDASLSIRNVRTRLYRGYCTSPEALANALQTIVALESEILELAAAVPAATPKDVETRQRFLGQFFEKAQDQDRLLRTFEKQCL